MRTKQKRTTRTKKGLFKLYIEPEKIDALKLMARHQTLLENKTVSWVEVVRRLVDNHLVANHIEVG
jgi:hypothetical protein